MIYRDFLEANYRIFPLWRARVADDGVTHCECGNLGCLAPFKHPRAANWQHTPEWDDEQIDTMAEAGFFDTGYGVLCKGLLVVDVDARNGGVDSLSKLLEAVPQIASAGLVVNTGSGGGSRHYYFAMPDAIAMVSHLPEYPGIDFKASGYVVGPGSHHKSGAVYEVADGTPFDIEAAPAGLVGLLRKPERHRTEYDGRSIDVSHSDLEDMLSHYPNDDLAYDDWIKVGMAIHQATGGTGYDLWAQWSARSSKHDDSHMDKRWHSFGRSANPVTIGTLIYHAEQHGWKMPVTFGPDDPDLDLALASDDEPAPDGLPFDIVGVDLKSPPGFVGEVARWIESNSRRPRANIAVAAALTAIGNVAGLRYIDDLDGVTANMFTFCIAGSRTGKEAIQQAVSTIHRAAGIAGATHGSIKSEQEIIKNLTRHQAAFYIVDEIGIFLQKVKNAQKRGGAFYLEGVIGTLMAAYSKADGFMLLTGDMKDDIRKTLLGELSALNRKLDEGTSNKGVADRIAWVEHALSNLDNGLERPFLSLMGFTTPVTFDDLVDFESATNGFIGRALLFNERDTAPRSKKGFVKTNLTRPMEATLQALYSGGEYDMQAAQRVEYYGDRVRIPTDDKARSMLEAALDWFEDQAEAHKGQTGLEALFLGAYELMAKVSLVLAIPEGLRTAEHVRWAFTLIRRDVEDKMRLVTVNDRAKDAPGKSLHAAIANLAAGDDGERVAVVINRLSRTYKREDIERAITKMETSGVLSRQSTGTYRGKPVERVRFIG